MTIHYLQHGGKSTLNANRAMYPSAKTTDDDKLKQSAHKAPAYFSNTRRLDFANQSGLIQYLADNKINVGDKIVLAAIPEKSFLEGFAWGVEKAIAGASLKLSLQFDGAELGTVNLATVDTDGIKLDKSKWLKKTDYIIAEVMAFPATTPVSGEFWVSPLVVAPEHGN